MNKFKNRIQLGLFILLTILSCGQVFAQNALKTPNISANALFLYRNSNQDTTTMRNGPDIEEGEVDFYADVDPYSRLNMVLSFSPIYTQAPNAPAGQATEAWQISPEELYAESNEVPRFTFKIGKFKAAFGKHNTLHTHAFPFIDIPLALDKLLGDPDGLADVGGSVAYLLPTNWFSEITLQYLHGDEANLEFNSPSSNNGVELAHVKNLWDLTDSMTFEFGLSYAYGANSLLTYTNLEAVDLTLKWRPVNGGRYHSGILGIEALQRTRGQAATDEVASGGDIWAQYQFAERWLANIRLDYLDMSNSVDPNLPNSDTSRYSAGVNFIATEFSAYRLEYSQTHGYTTLPNLGDEKRIYLLGNFTIGSHPAHSY